MITSTHYRYLPSFPDRQLPIRLHERPTNNDLVRRVLGVSAIVFALIAPPTVVYALFILAEANFSSLTDSAYRLIAVLLSLLILISFFARALLRWFMRRTGRHRIITINENQVTVREKTMFGTTEWSEPLAGYRCVKQEEKITVDGLQQSLVLSHPKPDRQVPVWVGDKVPDALVTGYQSLLARSTQPQARN